MSYNKSRIEILDGFRAIAIISVMLFHYFSRWAPPLNNVSLYPYSDKYSYFNYGYLGVEFFFIISGFVIYFTLDKTNYFVNFWKKRLIRLFPSILIATILTYVIFILFDRSNLFPNSHVFKNFLPSITFIAPELFNNFPGLFKTDYAYINGSYWSLWPEIQFYVFVSLIYYFDKKNFLIRYLYISAFLIAVNFLMLHLNNLKNLDGYTNTIISYYFIWIIRTFNLVTYLPFFSAGVIFYLLFKNKQNDIKTPVIVKLFLIFFILYAVYSGIFVSIRVIYILMFLFFYLFLYYPKVLRVFENRLFTNVGENSYFLYLIHENLGILLIYSFGSYLLSYSYLFTILVIVFLIFFSYLYSETIDKKLMGYLKKKLLEPKKL